MTHYTVTFTGTHSEKLEQALRATTDYLGQDRLTHLRTVLLAETKDTRRLVRLCKYACMLNGVREYYPVHAFTLYVLRARPER